MLVQCPECDRQITVTPRLAGRKVKCKCGSLMRMPKLTGAQGSAAAPPSPPPTPAPSLSADIQFECPTCHQRLSVPANAAGQVSQCTCGTQIRVPQAPAATVSSDPFALPNELPAGGLEPLDELEEVGLEPIDDAGYGLAPTNDPFVPMPTAPGGNPYGSTTTSTPAYLQPSGATGGKKRKTKRKTKKREASSGGDDWDMDGDGAGGFAGFFGFIMLLVVINVLSYLFDWPFWVY